MASRVKFYGVRGSIPSPLTHGQLLPKFEKLMAEFVAIGRDPAQWGDFLKEKTPLTYGGNTSCVLLECDGHIFVLDMGTGLRVLGNDLFGLMMKAKGLEVTFVCSHVHWDHIQGLPFFGPLFINKATRIENRWHFMGGSMWQGNAQQCLAGQMDAPTFPVSWDEIKAITTEIRFSDLHDRLSVTPVDGGPRVTFGKLDHPQDTYGSRFELPSGIVAYTTDNEPRDPNVPDPRLLRLADGARFWITDCQYSQHQYNGHPQHGGVPRHGWGHSYPQAVATTAVAAKVGTVILFHHDPMSTDERIEALRAETQELIKQMGGNSTVIAAWEGLEIPLD